MTRNPSAGLKMIEILLKHRPRANIHAPNANGFAPLNLYLGVNPKASRKVVRLLLESGSDPNIIPVD